MNINDILTLIILFAIICITLGFVFYRKILGLSLLVIKILFPVTVLIALSTLFLPSIYESFVEINFENTILAENLRSVDKTLTQVSNVQINISNTINSILNNGINEPIDKYQSNLYSEVLNFIVGVLRVIVLLVSILVLIFGLYIRYSFAGSFETISLQKQINELKKEIELLKSK